MNKEITLKILGIAVSGFVLVILFFAAVELRSEQMLKLTKTYIAARDIPPRTRISEEDLIEAEIAGDYLLDQAVCDKDQIIGKYTEIQGMIPAGSVFYRSMLKDLKDLPDYPTAQLRKGQSAYSLETDLARLGGTVVPGQRVDLFATILNRDSSTITGCLFQNVRVIAIKDHNGFDLDDPSGTGTPYLAILAVRSEDMEVLSACDEAGEIRLFSSSRSYDSASEASLVTDSPIYTYLRTQNGLKRDVFSTPEADT
ncbi:Flp pilus assembly protein CpaB [Stecheria intestinalis]|uniref:Flp pilus assembly protein CpaB n=1 Tax=Stecheria intestinalis TaxID=2606630 RepID=UPI0023F42771|nr:Flp pilus assembly protein CpaB [Stecheria intestinalis]MDD5880836.1 Flp pilus assembly protein CpaB [Stecheria intestinalis]